MIDRPNILLALLIPGFRMGRTGFVVGLTLATLLVLISVIGEEFYWNVDWLFAGALLGVWVAFMSIVNRFIDLGTPWLWLLLAPIPVINLLLVGRFLFGLVRSRMMMMIRHRRFPRGRRPPRWQRSCHLMMATGIMPNHRRNQPGAPCERQICAVREC